MALCDTLFNAVVFSSKYSSDETITVIAMRALDEEFY